MQDHRTATTNSNRAAEHSDCRTYGECNGASAGSQAATPPPPPPPPPPAPKKCGWTCQLGDGISGAVHAVGTAGKYAANAGTGLATGALNGVVKTATGGFYDPKLKAACFGGSDGLKATCDIATKVGDATAQVAGNAFLAVGTGGAGAALRGGLAAERGAEALNGIGRGERAISAAEDVGRACKNSFTGDTPVLLADGNTKPIADIALGDEVAAADPLAGTSGPRQVTALIRHTGAHHMVAITLDDSSTVVATDHHPIWDMRAGDYVDATSLTTSDTLLDVHGQRHTIKTLRRYDADLTAYNLTVGDLHTYYAGRTAVLVHNCNPLDGTQYTDKVLAQMEMDGGHGFPSSIDSLARQEDVSMLRGADGVLRQQVKMAGAHNGRQGTYHYIIEKDGSVNHRLFDDRMR